MREFRRPLIANLLLAAMLASLMPARSRAAESPPSGRYAELPGVKLWFTDTGGPGTPVVLLHANTGTSANWAAQAAAFSRANYRVIAFDRRGWGKSTADPASGPQPGTRSPGSSRRFSMKRCWPSTGGIRACVAHFEPEARRHGRTCSGHPRLARATKDVDARAVARLRAFSTR